MRLCISVPLPSAALSPNGAHGHWAKKSRARKSAKEVAWGVTLEALNGRKWTAKAARLTATAYYRVQRGRDDDNFLSSLKSARDGIAKALGIDDKYFVWGEPVFAIDKSNPRVTITIEQMENRL